MCVCLSGDRFKKNFNSREAEGHELKNLCICLQIRREKFWAWGPPTKVLHFLRFEKRYPEKVFDFWPRAPKMFFNSEIQTTIPKKGFHLLNPEPYKKVGPGEKSPLPPPSRRACLSRDQINGNFRDVDGNRIKNQCVYHIRLVKSMTFYFKIFWLMAFGQSTERSSNILQ